MEKENKKQKSKLTTKELTKIFGAIWFGLVFIFTFCLISHDIRDNPTNKAIAAGVIFGTLGVSVIVWLIMFLVIRKKSKTENDKKIQEALKKIEKEKQAEEQAIKEQPK